MEDGLNSKAYTVRKRELASRTVPHDSHALALLTQSKRSGGGSVVASGRSAQDSPLSSGSRDMWEGLVGVLHIGLGLGEQLSRFSSDE